MPDKRLLFVYNPHAGTSKLKGFLMDVLDVFADAGYEVTVHPTRCSGDAARAAREKSGGYDLLVCSGGDGTLAEAVSGMLDRHDRIPIGYIPSGSTNDFAESLRIPMNMTAAAESAVNGRLFASDVGRFNGRAFIYVAAFGIFTDVSYGTRQDLKNAFGHAAYIMEAAKRLPQLRSWRLKAEYDGGTLEGDFLLGIVSNSISIGGIKNMAGTDVVLDDGLFEVTLVRLPLNIQDFSDAARASLNGDEENGLIYNFKTNWIRFTGEEQIPWTLDGEYGGSPREAELRIIPRALHIVVPKDVQLPSLEDGSGDSSEGLPGPADGSGNSSEGLPGPEDGNELTSEKHPDPEDESGSSTETVAVPANSV